MRRIKLPGCSGTRARPFCRGHLDLSMQLEGRIGPRDSGRCTMREGTLRSQDGADRFPGILDVPQQPVERNVSGW